MNYLRYDTIQLNGLHLKGNEIIGYCTQTGQSNMLLLADFIGEWLNDDPNIRLQTSGSTGKPKTISVSKNQMLESAAMTANYFDFKAGQTALLCLPMSYIAGKMMVVRALLSKLNLKCIEPGNSPIAFLPDDLSIDFAPLIPMQLSRVKDSKTIRKILLGGGPVDSRLEEDMQALQAEIYHGYGMTETLSHVAIRSINGKKRSENYHALAGITFKVDERGCLIIHVPFLKEPVHTNDMVHLLDERTFVWKGRADFVVNSGGIKLFPEGIEKKLSTLIPERFFLFGLPDEKLGEKLCLFMEGKQYESDRFDRLKTAINNILEKYERPKRIFFIDEFQSTASGKIKRADSVALRREN